MCGILALISPQNPIPPATRGAVLGVVLDRVKNRGPDSCRTVEVRCGCTPVATTALSVPPNSIQITGEEGSAQYDIQLTSTVLSLRGTHPTLQPLVCEDTGNVLCWNGEAWRIAGEELEGERNDGEEVFRVLLDVTGRGEDDTSSTNTDEDVDGPRISKALNSIEGPFAFIFLDKVHGKMWFGRDCLGRRSLLWYRALKEREGFDGLVVTSVGDGDKEKGWREVEADGVYYVDLKRPLDIPENGLLGGLTDLGVVHVPFLPQGSGRKGIDDGLNGDGNRERGVHMTLPYPPLNIDISNVMVSPITKELKEPQELLDLLKEAVRVRVRNVYTPDDDKQRHEASIGSKIAILFSGGLDCTVLARLAHEVLPEEESVDLLNVAFENPRVVKAYLDGPTPAKAKSKTKNQSKNNDDREGEQSIPSAAPAETNSTPTLVDPYNLCPDRLTSLSSFRELQHACPKRKFNLVHINIPHIEFLQHRGKIISLIHPHNTEMDLSIASAFYFASRGVGVLYPTSAAYTTPARILLSGLGADELFAGYARHAGAFRAGGWEGLVRELAREVERIGRRNLGRDDRVLAEWGKEARYPFLDERVVGWAMRMGVQRKCGFGQAEVRKDGRAQAGKDREGEKEGDVGGVGLEMELAGKRILRVVAEMLDMPGVAGERKRAIQFGARTAKMGDGNGGENAIKAGRKVKGTQELG